MMNKKVLFEEREKVGIVSLNQPDSRNALSRDLLNELAELLNKVASEKKVYVVIIKGVGKIFSSGHDLKEAFFGNGVQDVLETLKACFLSMRAMREMPQPVIAQVHGVATAAGCQLVAACDLAVAASDAVFATPGVKIGLFCSTPAVFISRSLGRKKAMEMLLTGEYMTAQDAMVYGLINRVAPPEQLEEVTFSLATSIAQYSLTTIGIGKKAFYEQINMEDFQALSYASQVLAINSTTADSREGIGSFFEKKKPIWTNR